MTTKDEFASLYELLTSFEKLDAVLLDELQAQNFGMLTQTMEAKKEINRFLAKQDPLAVGPDLAVKLKKIRDNHGYVIDTVLAALGSMHGHTFSQEEEEDIDIVLEFSKNSAGQNKKTVGKYFGIHTF